MLASQSILHDYLTFIQSRASSREDSEIPTPYRTHSRKWNICIQLLASKIQGTDPSKYRVIRAKTTKLLLVGLVFLN